MKPKRFLKQDAVLWNYAGNDPFGKPKYDPPVEIKCRWEETSETFLGSKSTETQVSKAVVMVDRDVKELDVLWLGTLSLLVDPSKPFKQDKAYAVQKFEKIPDRKARKFLRTAYL